MPRRPKPSQVLAELELLIPSRRYELFRRMQAYAEAYLDARITAGAPAGELARLRRDVEEFAANVAWDSTYPLDTPPEPPLEPRPEQPLAPEGTEAWMSDFLTSILEQDA